MLLYIYQYIAGPNEHDIFMTKKLVHKFGSYIYVVSAVALVFSSVFRYYLYSRASVLPQADYYLAESSVRVSYKIKAGSLMIGAGYIRHVGCVDDDGYVGATH